MLANPQFKTTRDDPTLAGQVTFEVHQSDASMQNTYALAAHCHDASTCNSLAAMYVTAVKSSHPQLFCGTLPTVLGHSLKQFDLLAGGADANLPDSRDPVGSCARLAACTAAAKPNSTEDLGASCQKAPGAFKTDCARKFPCADVVACLGG